VNREIYEKASEWRVEWRSGDIDGPARERLDQWFRTSPEHVRAFLELSALWEAGGDPELSCAHGTEDLIAGARAMTNVVELNRAPPEARPFLAEVKAQLARESPPMDRVPEAQLSTPADSFSTPRSVFRYGYPVAASLALVTIAAAGLMLYSVLNPTYATGIGEQRTVQLPDGSIVELNARSRIRVRYSDRGRDVELLTGQALFKVAKNPARPFVVKTDGTRVRAVGTQFEVYRKTTSTTVTVLEGRVAVLSQASEGPADAPSQELTATPGAGSATPENGAPRPDSPAILVSAGEQVTVTPSQVTKPAHADVAAATAWTQRELVFDSTPLADVAQEFNRYNAKPLIVSDGKLKDFHVTGVFSSTDPSSLLKFLRAQRNIEVVETESGIRITSK
jgi:transmembrane sensor